MKRVIKNFAIHSGISIKELTTYLKSINPKNTLTVFVLVKS